MKFQILPHVLRTYQPNRCPGRQPNIDFSMGFPYPWLLKFTDITIPSHHTQDGKRFDAEVVLSHVYSKNNPKKMVSSDSKRVFEWLRLNDSDFIHFPIRRVDWEPGNLSGARQRIGSL